VHNGRANPLLELVQERKIAKWKAENPDASFAIPKSSAGSSTQEDGASESEADSEVDSDFSDSDIEDGADTDTERSDSTSTVRGRKSKTAIRSRKYPFELPDHLRKSNSASPPQDLQFNPPKEANKFWDSPSSDNSDESGISGGSILKARVSAKSIPDWANPTSKLYDSERVARELPDMPSWANLRSNDYDLVRADAWYAIKLFNHADVTKRTTDAATKDSATEDSANTYEDRKPIDTKELVVPTGAPIDDIQTALSPEGVSTTDSNTDLALVVDPESAIKDVPDEALTSNDCDDHTHESQTGFNLPEDSHGSVSLDVGSVQSDDADIQSSDIEVDGLGEFVGAPVTPSALPALPNSSMVQTPLNDPDAFMDWLHEDYESALLCLVDTESNIPVYADPRNPEYEEDAAYEWVLWKVDPDFYNLNKDDQTVSASDAPTESQPDDETEAVTTETEEDVVTQLDSVVERPLSKLEQLESKWKQAYQAHWGVDDQTSRVDVLDVGSTDIDTPYQSRSLGEFEGVPLTQAALLALPDSAQNAHSSTTCSITSADTDVPPEVSEDTEIYGLGEFSDALVTPARLLALPNSATPQTSLVQAVEVTAETPPTTADIELSEAHVDIEVRPLGKFEGAPTAPAALLASPNSAPVSSTCVENITTTITPVQSVSQAVLDIRPLGEFDGAPVTPSALLALPNSGKQQSPISESALNHVEDVSTVVLTGDAHPYSLGQFEGAPVTPSALLALPNSTSPPSPAVDEQSHEEDASMMTSPTEHITQPPSVEKAVPTSYGLGDFDGAPVTPGALLALPNSASASSLHTDESEVEDAGLRENGGTTEPQAIHSEVSTADFYTLGEFEGAPVTPGALLALPNAAGGSSHPTVLLSDEYGAETPTNITTLAQSETLSGDQTGSSFESYVDVAAARVIEPIEEPLHTLRETSVIQLAVLRNEDSQPSTLVNLPPFPNAIAGFDYPAQEWLVTQQAHFHAAITVQYSVKLPEPADQTSLAIPALGFKLSTPLALPSFLSATVGFNVPADEWLATQKTASDALMAAEPAVTPETTVARTGVSDPTVLDTAFPGNNIPDTTVRSIAPMKTGRTIAPMKTGRPIALMKKTVRSIAPMKVSSAPEESLTSSKESSPKIPTLSPIVSVSTAPSAPSPKKTVTFAPTVSVKTVPSAPSSPTLPHAPVDIDRALLSARNTFLGGVSLEDFIDALPGGDLVHKMDIIETFALLSAEEKEMMDIALPHSLVPQELTSPLMQRRVKLGTTTLFTFLRGIQFDEDGETSLLNVAEAFRRAARHDSFGPSQKMAALLRAEADV
jgi:hypothetical protein